MSDLEFQKVLAGQNFSGGGVRTIVAAATIAPTTFLTKLSGTTALANITPPMSGAHLLAIVAGTTTAAFTTSGNIAGVTTAADTTSPILFIFDPTTGDYTRTIA